MGIRVTSETDPPLKSGAAPAQRAGTESLLMMDDVTRFSVAVSILAVEIVNTLVSGPSGPHNAEIRPDYGYASSGPLRPRTMAFTALPVGGAYQGEGMDW